MLLCRLQHPFQRQTLIRLASKSNMPQSCIGQKPFGHHVLTGTALTGSLGVCESARVVFFPGFKLCRCSFCLMLYRLPHAKQVKADMDIDMRSIMEQLLMGTPSPTVSVEQSTLHAHVNMEATMTFPLQSIVRKFSVMPVCIKPCSVFFPQSHAMHLSLLSC